MVVRSTSLRCSTCCQTDWRATGSRPTVGLDPVARQSVWQHVLHLKDVLRTTMLVTTHYMEEADDLCDRIALINHGRISTVGTPAELKACVGPAATLDDVFARLAGGELQAQDDYKSVRRTRASARSHG